MAEKGQVLTPEERARCVRKNLSHPQRVRDRIRIGMLVRRMQKEAAGELELTQGQRESAKYLISLVIPKPVEVQQIIDQSITVNVVKFGRDAAE